MGRRLVLMGISGVSSFYSPMSTSQLMMQVGIPSWRENSSFIISKFRSANQVSKSYNFFVKQHTRLYVMRVAKEAIIYNYIFGKSFCVMCHNKPLCIFLRANVITTLKEKWCLSFMVGQTCNSFSVYYILRFLEMYSLEFRIFL